MAPSVLTVVEIEVVHQKREYVGLFVKRYLEWTGHEPSDNEIAHYMECQWWHEVVSYVNLGDHYRADI